MATVPEGEDVEPPPAEQAMLSSKGVDDAFEEAFLSLSLQERQAGCADRVAEIAEKNHGELFDMFDSDSVRGAAYNWLLLADIAGEHRY